MLTLQNVSLRYDTGSEIVTALNNVNFQVNVGEMVAVMGASGSGKTSLINVIAGLQEAESGSVCVAGYMMHEMSASQRAAARLADIGVIFQDHNLIPEFTALENVMLPLRAQGQDLQSVKTLALDSLSRVGLGDFARRLPKELSGGQKQRVGIARALTGGKKILLADEPTGSLDTKNSVEIFETLRELADSGVCVVVSTHDSAVANIAHDIREMRDGVIDAKL
ncbi:ABC transporter ATP-binding protein [Leucobacter sp. OH2974_COT-288]|uniref:Putative ABC transport system ATP-binding protein n=1 Tax=Canibacter oris TaxID=1365628 RepID=A0A840DL30_9MICO|nr:ABC transporter ATP-binding protein [Canibacter oris]MBB4072182.1 putative ABC transport system ATP-binding protein [Canibacter oris]RRD35769.1 ABC transporter ATP-binding protein [Leucobacter sp. OH2974_COT-288]